MFFEVAGREIGHRRGSPLGLDLADRISAIDADFALQALGFLAGGVRLPIGEAAYRPTALAPRAKPVRKRIRLTPKRYR